MELHREIERYTSGEVNNYSISETTVICILAKFKDIRLLFCSTFIIEKRIFILKQIHYAIHGWYHAFPLLKSYAASISYMSELSFFFMGWGMRIILFISKSSLILFFPCILQMFYFLVRRFSKFINPCTLEAVSFLFYCHFYLKTLVIQAMGSSHSDRTILEKVLQRNQDTFIEQHCFDFSFNTYYQYLFIKDS